MAVKLHLFRAGKVIERANKPETRDGNGVDVICWIQSSNRRRLSEVFLKMDKIRSKPFENLQDNKL